MNRGADRQPVFLDDSDRIDFGRQLAWLHDHLGVTVIAYCLMGNHYHLILKVPDGKLSEAMQHLGSVYTRHFNDRHERDGPLFRGRFHAIPIEDDAYFLTAIRYIHLNPLGLADVNRPADYRWSSYRTYLGLRPAPAFLDTTLLMAMLGDSVERLVRLTEDRAGDEGPGLGPRVGDALVTPTELNAVIGGVVAIEDLCDDDLNPVGLERTLKILLADRAGAAVRRMVADDLGERSPRAERSARRRAEARLMTDPVLARVLDATLTYLAA